MIRVRFHGRGGHGVKTASRILGTAAFLAGYQVQDSPVYGAERRGAAVTAFTRVAEQPILERGPIDFPDLIIVADETLLRDPSAAVSLGFAQARAVFVNAPASDALRAFLGPEVALQTWDLTRRSIELFGRATALSAGLAAASARLCGLVSPPQLEAAIEEELQSLGLHAEAVATNQQLAREVFTALTVVPMTARLQPQPCAETVALEYEGPLRGAPSILAAGNAEQRNTGAWRIERPVVLRDVCTRCGLCLVQCPDGTIAVDGEGYPIIDYDHCKGCMICREVCPVHAIDAEREVQAW